MKYNHPTEMPVSKTLYFDWIGKRIPLAEKKQGGDTHPQTWADDDEIYVGTGDPGWALTDGKLVHGFYPESDHRYGTTIGQVFEKLTGEPESLGLERVHDMPDYTGFGGMGPKPCGLICVDGVLYYAVQNMLGKKEPPWRKNSQHGTDATIICSRDYGKTWAPERNAAPMFPGSEFGGLSFVQYGKNNDGAFDDYVYAVSGDQWDNGRFIRLGRVLKDQIMNRESWEFFSRDSAGNIEWIKDLTKSQPILDIEGHMGLPEMVYIHGIKKYLLLTWALHTDFYSPTGSELTILESDNLWGPFSLLHYEWMWDSRKCCPYTPRIPLKWFDQENLEGYILHSGSWGYMGDDGIWVGFPEYYRPHLKKFKLSYK